MPRRFLNWKVNLSSLWISSISIIIFIMIDWLIHGHHRLLISLAILLMIIRQIIYVFWWTVWEIRRIIHVFKMIFINTVLDTAESAIIYLLVLELITLVHWIVYSHWRAVVFVILIILLIWGCDVRWFHVIVHRVL